jgi:hypothetical protein
MQLSSAELNFGFAGLDMSIQAANFQAHEIVDFLLRVV